MEVQDAIRTIRELNNLTQEDMAEKLNISVNGYSKLERGITKISLKKLEQIANIFNINVSDLYSVKEKGFLYFFSEHNSENYYNVTETIISENERLKLELKYKDALFAKLEQENQLLKEMIALLKQR